MAGKYTVKGMDEFLSALEKLEGAARPAAKMAVYDAAGIVAESVKKSLNETVSDKATGELADSLGIAGITGVRAYVNTSVSFDGYDRSSKPSEKYPKGTPNVLKARALNSGTSDGRQPPRPFFAKGVQRARTKAKKAMVARAETELEKRTK